MKDDIGISLKRLKDAAGLLRAATFPMLADLICIRSAWRKRVGVESAQRSVGITATDNHDRRQSLRDLLVGAGTAQAYLVRSIVSPQVFAMSFRDSFLADTLIFGCCTALFVFNLFITFAD